MNISKDARRYIVDNLIAIGYFFGANGRAYDFFNKFMPDLVDLNGIARHYDRFDDWDINRLLYTEADLLDISDKLFCRFCEEYLDPIYDRRERIERDDFEWEYVDHTAQCEKVINEGLAMVGLQIESKTNENGLKIFKVKSRVQLPTEPIKNIIFAANDTKPDIVIDNALENKMRIVSVGDALVYSEGIPMEGISWKTLVNWYEQFTLDDPYEELVVKLDGALDSVPEKLFFKTYLEYIKANGAELPALIPQVYLYYDPKTKAARGGNSVFEHQRMDFMMILSPEHRVVIEIDGIQHYASDRTIDGTHYKCANVDKYAEMMKAHRDMVLNGYDVYRFGGKELYIGNGRSEEEVKTTISTFFDGLFKKYKIK